jgi:hypothetical protein
MRPPGGLLRVAAKHIAWGSCTVCATCSAAVLARTPVAPGPDLARASCPSRRRLSVIQFQGKSNSKANKAACILNKTLKSMQI